MGTLFPPMGPYHLILLSATLATYHFIHSAVAARFGFGGDFWLNLLLTICGYIPGKRASLRQRTTVTLTTIRPRPQFLHSG